MIVDLTGLPRPRKMRARMALGALSFLRHDDVRLPDREAEVRRSLLSVGIDPAHVVEGVTFLIWVAKPDPVG